MRDMVSHSVHTRVALKDGVDSPSDVGSCRTRYDDDTADLYQPCRLAAGRPDETVREPLAMLQMPNDLSAIKTRPAPCRPLLFSRMRGA
jgi:hypothetical protein